MFNLIIGAGLIFGSTAAAEINALKLPSPPAQAVPVEVEVERWSEARIPLRVAGTAIAPEFRIRTRPGHGTLTEPVRLDELTGELLYRHTGTEREQVDSFTYSVRSTRGVSAPARVTIKIVDPPPALVVPDSLDFGAVTAGNRTEPFLLEIRNKGGGTLTGHLDLPDGWLLEGDPGYSLGPYDLALFNIVAAPRSPGTPTGTLTYSSSPGTATKLAVEASPAVTVTPAELHLKTGATGAGREGRITLANVSDRPVQIELQGDRRLLLPKPFEVRADSQTTVTIGLPPSDAAPFSGQVRITGPGLDSSVRVEAASEVPLIQIEPDPLDFGEVETGATAKIGALLINLSDTAVEARLDLESGIRVDGPRRITLTPGASTPLALTWNPVEPGTLRSPLKVRSPIGEAMAMLQGSARVPVKGDEATPATGRQPAPTPTPVLAAPIETVAVSGRGTREFRLEWQNRSGSEDIRFRLDRSRIRMGPGRKALFEWIPLPNVTYGRAGASVTAHVTGMEPGQQCTMRIVAIHADGRQIPSLPFQVQLNPEPQRKIGPWHFAAVLALLCAGGGVLWVLIRKRRCRR